MKKLLLLAVLITVSFVAFGQKIAIGLRGGLNFAELQSSAAGSSSSHTSDSFTSFSVGAFTDIKFNNLSLQPALVLTGKGGQVASGDGGTIQFDLRYLQIPVNLVYHAPVLIGDIYIGGGPYLAFGAASTLTENGPGGNAYINTTFGSTGDFTSTETGINGIAGLQFKSGFLVHINYDFGLTNILNNNGPEAGLGTIKTRTLGVSIGFVF